MKLLASCVVGFTLLAALPVFSQSVSGAVVCQDDVGAPFFVTLIEDNDEGATALIGSELYSVNPTKSGLALTDLDSSTLLIFGDTDGRISVKGLLDGETVGGTCFDVEEQFDSVLSAVQTVLVDRISALETQLADLTTTFDSQLSEKASVIEAQFRDEISALKSQSLIARKLVDEYEDIDRAQKAQIRDLCAQFSAAMGNSGSEERKRTFLRASGCRI